MTRPVALVLTLGLTLTAGSALARGKKKQEAPAPAPAAAPAEAPVAPETPAEPEPADGPYAGIVSYRHNLLESVAKHFGLLKLIVQGKVEGREADMAEHARAIHDASTDFVSMFPEGSGPDAYPQTDALPTIWADMAGFEAAAARFETESAALLELAEAKDVEGVKAGFGKLGGACGGCHETFRKDDD